MKKTKLRSAITIIACLSLSTLMANAKNPIKVYGKAKPFTAQELPEGELKSKLETLNPKAREKAMKWLHTITFDELDAAKHLRLDNEGGVFIVCPLGHKHPHEEGGNDKGATSDSTGIQSPGNIPSRASSTSQTSTVAYAVAPISSPPAFHSKLNATKRIYLDFNGGVVSGKAWGGGARYDTRAWSLDADETTFSDAEQAEIRRIWERTSEDFAPFNIDVTTDVAYDPDNYKGDQNQVGWVLFTPGRDKAGASCPHDGYGGKAYLNVFSLSNYSYHQPAWALPFGAADATETGSHEMGHNLGLDHDNTTIGEYYGGHGETASSPSWGPIMGGGYFRNVSQWSKGQYYAANQLEDDLAIISSKVPYRTDDHGDSFATSTVLPGPDFKMAGIVERSGNPDFFTFTTGNAVVELKAAAYKCDTATWGSNLDIQLELYNSAGTLVGSNNLGCDVDASISPRLAAGKYYVVVRPSGAGSPLTNPPSGYTAYGSLGQYSITGRVVPDPVLFWRNDNGLVHHWILKNGIQQSAADVYGSPIPWDWKIVDVADLNGDGHADIIWRNDNGLVHHWILRNGIYQSAGDVYGIPIPWDWKIVDVEDLNGDGHADIIWRNDNGQVVSWILRNGVKQSEAYVSGNPLGPDWKIVDVADLNADGHADIILRNDNGQVYYWILRNGIYHTGGFVYEFPIPWDWKIVDVADVNGDGHADIIWRNDTGLVHHWILRNGIYQSAADVSSSLVGWDWKIVDVKDLNGDGHADIIWRHDTGLVHHWILRNGIYQSAADVSSSLVGWDWKTVPVK